MMKPILNLLTILSLAVATYAQTSTKVNAAEVIASPGKNLRIPVNCGNQEANVKTVADGLKLLGNARPAVLLISGTCHENVIITSLDRITLEGNPTATIDGGSDPNVSTVFIADSRNVQLTSLTITGGGDGLDCVQQSYCLLNQVTVQNAQANGIRVAASRAALLETVIQNNGAEGMAINSASVGVVGGSVTGNGTAGISLRNGGILGVASDDPAPYASIGNNLGPGIMALSHSTVSLNGVNITGNSGDGVTVQNASEMTTVLANISNNTGHQVRIGDLSFVRFAGLASNTITGSSFPDVVCDPQFSIARQLAANAPGATTNCPPDLPPAP